MIVRVYDKESDTYFRSEVYAYINYGWYEENIVIVPSEHGNYFKIIECIDKSDINRENFIKKNFINRVIANTIYQNYEWTHQYTGDVDKNIEDYSNLISGDISFYSYSGYSWIYNNKPFLTELLHGGKIPTKDYEHLIPNPNRYKLDDWNYIDNQADIDFLLNQTGGFHDSVINELHYTSGCYVDDNRGMHITDSERNLTIIFHSQWCKPIKMIFFGITALNLRPWYMTNIYGVTILMQNEIIYFNDDPGGEINKNYEGTWIESYGLRWRFID